MAKKAKLEMDGAETGVTAVADEVAGQGNPSPPTPLPGVPERGETDSDAAVESPPPKGAVRCNACSKDGHQVYATPDPTRPGWLVCPRCNCRQRDQAALKKATKRANAAKVDRSAR